MQYLPNACQMTLKESIQKLKKTKGTINMTNVSKAICIAALLLAGVAPVSFAQTQTIETMNLDIDLTAVSQGPVTTNHDGTISNVQCTRITSRSIIQVLGAALGDTFSKRARLVLIAPLDSLDDWTIQIQDGTNSPVDVTGFFDHKVGAVSVSGARTNTKNGNSAVTDYSVDSFSLQDQTDFPALTEHFTVSGFTILDSRAVMKHKGTVVDQSVHISAQVSGTGDNQGTPTVITGSISAEGCENGDSQHDHGD